MFMSQYDIKCSLLEDPIIKSTITAVAKSNINDLRPVCEKGTVINDLYRIIFVFSSVSYLIDKNTKPVIGCMSSFAAVSKVDIEQDKSLASKNIQF